MTGPDSTRHLYFEDYPPGMVMTGGSYVMTEAEIIEFGRRFDPLPVHVDKAVAERSSFGGLIAAGVHIMAVQANLHHQMIGDDQHHYIAGLGFDKLRFQVPVRPGDTLSKRVEVLDARRSSKDSSRGVLRFYNEVFNQRGEVVVSFEGAAMIECRSTLG